MYFCFLIWGIDFSLNESFYLWIVFSHCSYLYCWRHLYWWRKLGVHPSILDAHLVCMYCHTTQVSLTFLYTRSHSVSAAHCVLQVGNRMKSLSFTISPSHENLGFGDLFVITSDVYGRAGIEPTSSTVLVCSVTTRPPFLCLSLCNL